MSIREAARKIPFLYHAAGYFRYLRHKRDLARAEAEHASGSELPPPALRYRVHRSLDPASYRQVGQSVAGDIAAALDGNGVSLDGRTALDLGSGPGRVAYWFKRKFPSCVLHCSDIDAEAIEWAGDNLGQVASFHLNAPDPPLAFPDASFDFVYSISLFTHLDRAMQDAWLDELRRVAKPGGHVLATTHGRFAMGSCTPAEIAEVDTAGFCFRVDRRGKWKLDGLPDFYQTTFHSKAYVTRHWGGYFDIVAHIEGGIGGHQDIVLMRRRQGGPPG